jgi:hypothetical protein
MRRSATAPFSRSFTGLIFSPSPPFSRNLVSRIFGRSPTRTATTWYAGRRQVYLRHVEDRRAHRHARRHDLHHEHRQHRPTLGRSDRARFVRRRKIVYEAMHPETRHGGDRKSSRKVCDLNERFTADTAAATGRSERSVQRDVTRAERIAPDVLEAIAGTPFDRGRKPDALAQRAKFTARRKAIYLALHPETARGVAGAMGANTSMGRSTWGRDAMATVSIATSDNENNDLSEKPMSKTPTFSEDIARRTGSRG